jgi:IMP dehydrogenase/GMP reductase
MEKLINDLKLAKDLYGLNNKLFIIAGNIGHPRSAIKFEGLCYGIRVGIGHGSPCLTTEQTAIGYPMASLVSETYFELHSTNYRSSKLKIIADGGFRSYSDIIKALALGADYVILGGIFNKALESAGDTYIQNAKHAGWVEPGPKIDQYDPKYVDMLKAGTNFYKLYRGMSTKEVQRLFGNKQIKTSEGITKLNKVEYTLNSWADNFKHYLRSAMSYTDSKTLIDFIGKVEIINITDNAYRRFHK